VEIPDKDKYPVLHDLVCKHMMHVPCGVLHDKCACMQDGVYNIIVSVRVPQSLY
jgi:hypothetical protein